MAKSAKSSMGNPPPPDPSALRQVREAIENMRAELGDQAVDSALQALRAAAEPAQSGDQKTADLSALGERRLVSALFADFVNFTGMVEAGNPELLRGLLSRAFDTLVPVIDRYGGTIEKIVGDGIMALFGAPRSREDDSARACLAALALRVTLRDFNQAHGTALAMHYGIGTGLVIAGPVGTAAYRSYAALGDAVIRAARLAAGSDPDEIRLDMATRALAGDGFDFEPVGELKLKGFSSHTPVFRLSGGSAKSGLSGDGGAAASADSQAAFVGRQAELQTLRACLASAPAAGSLIGLVGEAGIGKSRLVAELLKTLPDRSAWFHLVSACHSYQQDSAFAFWASLLENLAGISMNDNQATRRQRLSAWLGSALPDTALHEALYRICGLGGAEDEAGDDSGWAFQAEETETGHTAEAVRQVLTGLAAGRRVLLVCEDFHWSDQSSRLLLDKLLAAEWPAGFTCLCLSRPAAFFDRKPAVCAKGSVEWHCLRLEALPATDSQELARAINPAVDPLAVAEAAGNPLFVEEIAKAVSPVPAADQDRTTLWHTAGKGGIFRLVNARIDSCPPRVAESVRMAAVLGDRFPIQLLAAMGGKADRTELAETQLFYNDSESDLWSFRHALLRDMALEFYPEQARRLLHSRAAQTIKQLFPFYAQLRPEILAWHWQMAGAGTRALPYYKKAARRMHARKADTEALVLVQKAMALPEAASPLHQADLQLLAGRILSGLGQTDQAGRAFDIALAIQKQMSNVSQQIYITRCKSYSLALAGQTPAAAALLETAAELASLADSQSEMLRIRLDRAWLQARTGQGEKILGELTTCRRLALERGLCDLVDQADKLMSEQEAAVGRPAESGTGSG